MSQQLLEAARLNVADYISRAFYAFGDVKSNGSHWVNNDDGVSMSLNHSIEPYEGEASPDAVLTVTFFDAASAVPTRAVGRSVESGELLDMWNASECAAFNMPLDALFFPLVATDGKPGASSNTMIFNSADVVLGLTADELRALAVEVAKPGDRDLILLYERAEDQFTGRKRPGAKVEVDRDHFTTFLFAAGLRDLGNITDADMADARKMRDEALSDLSLWEGDAVHGLDHKPVIVASINTEQPLRNDGVLLFKDEAGSQRMAVFEVMRFAEISEDQLTRDMKAKLKPDNSMDLDF